MRSNIVFAVVRSTVFSAVLFGASAQGDDVPRMSRPNIVWILAEDISTELSCYGHPAVETPHIDGFARQGVLYRNAFTTAPSCTPSRNAMMTGVYQTATDTQDQRRRGVVLPDGMRPITHLLREAGYYTAIGCGYSGKTDLNFTADPLFDGNDWKHRKDGQPFFAQITLNITHRQSKGKWKDWAAVREESKEPVDPEEVVLPPYFPDDAACRLDWARYLDAMEMMDGQVGEILARLESEGIADETLVIFIGDNGACHLRGKCWLYDSGIHVPLVVRWPGWLKANSETDELVSTLDVSATVLAAAGAELPAYLDGHPLFGPRKQERRAVFAARDLIDEVMDRIRCVRTKRFKYIRNYTPENGYNECVYVQNNRPMLAAIRALGAEGKLNETQKLILKTVKPKEELYDLANDPFELHNLALSSEHAKTMKRMRRMLDEWIEETGDLGLKQAE